MDAILIFLTSLGTTYLAVRLAGRGRFTLADLSICIFCTLAALSMAHFLGASGAGRAMGLPLLVACVLPIGLESLQQRSFWS